METGGILEYKEPNLSYHSGETLLITVYAPYGNLT